MNFFEQQEKARKHSRWIVFAFIGVTLLIIMAVNLIVLTLAGLETQVTAGTNYVTHGAMNGLFSSQSWANNASLLFGSSVVTGGVIGLASFGKITSLRGGGGKVARDMGGVLVTPDTSDALRRRLHNVVEEIALASGTPVPEVYVLENEQGINAFAAGYTPADAAVAVTQGTLEKLSRAELQGVIAHEFSHIFNGDMRINIRMMGIIFGIMVIAIIGRKFLSSSRYRGYSSNRNNGASAAIAIGFALMAVGYIGLFFARWMKSALSRQREYLADASAVQFTRDPMGISGALKKIAAYNHSSYLTTDSEEVSHMLFGSGYRSLMFSTHPPLESRIERIEKGFDPQEIERLGKKLKDQEHREHIQAELAAKEQKNESLKDSGIFDINSMIENIGNPEFERVLAAALLTASIADPLTSAARSLEWAPEVLFYCLLDENEEIRNKQLLIVAKEMGDISESKLSHLLNGNPPITDEQRLPLLEICFPTLKRRPLNDIQRILETIDKLIYADNKVDTFEYLLSRLISMHLHESKNPKGTKLHGTAKLEDCVDELSSVVSILASHGQDNSGTKGLQVAQRAYKNGMEVIDVHYTNLSFTGEWQKDLDNALDVLNNLKPTEKHLVVKALAATVMSDDKMVTAEHEMLRVICARIHVPLPMLRQANLD